MSLEFTEKINRQNIQSVREQIAMKNNYCNPFYATMDNAMSNLTDQDVFPYSRYFRGEYDKDYPIVFEREAGWRPRKDRCYKLECPGGRDFYPNHCFETACSIVQPCYPEVLRTYEHQELLNQILNQNCITQYR